ncbi:MAG: thiamine pyrophosphate-dependent dehydrogenase E1 component subunit alpha [Phycisphaeraceae bacterium]
MDPAEIRDLAGSLVRILDDDGRARGSWSSALELDDLVAGLRAMLTVRELDRRMLAAQRQGKTSFYMQALGEEAIACAAWAALRDGDMHFPTYRQQGLLVAAGYPLADMMSQVYSNARDPMLGRQMPVFYSARAHGFFSISGNLGTQFSQSVGWAMAAAMRGSDDIAMGWIGDGATAESDFHAALVFASTYRAPVVLSVVNNQWAISTPQATALGSATTFAAKAHGFGMPGLRVDGNDYLAVHAATGWAAARARSGYGATLIEFVTYRGGAHSSSDDPSKYRPTDEFEHWPLGDPVDRLRQHLEVAWGWTPDDQGALQDAVIAEVRDAQIEAEKAGTLVGGPHVSPRTMFDDVFEVQPPHLRRQRQSMGF